MVRPSLLGARDRPSDPSTVDSEFRWTTTNRSATGFQQTDRTPTTSGDAPPKRSNTSGGGAAILKILAGIALFYYFAN